MAEIPTMGNKPADIPAADPMAEAVKRAKELAAKMLPAAGLNGSDDNNSRKRPLDEGDDGPQVKKPSFDVMQGGATSMGNPQAIAQAAIAKVGVQFGMQTMITVEISVPNRMVGLVIGRGGEMINRLQSESGARIQVAPDGSEVNGERQVTICGTLNTIEKAKQLVNKVVEDAGGATSMPVCAQSNVEVGQEISELLIPANKVGLVIGKGGEMIKALQDRANCKMQMIQDGPYASAPDKPLRMTGPPENCRKAKELVMQLIEQKELEARGIIPGELIKADGTVVQVQVPKPLVGFVIGRNGEHINNIQSTCGVRLQFQNEMPGTEYRIATISGDPQNCQKAKLMVEDIVQEMSQQGGWKPPGLQQAGVQPRIELPNPTGPGVQTVQFAIPHNKCGLIIGKGGEAIRQLQVESGAHIELHRGMHPNPQEKLFNIRGTPPQVQVAQQLMRQKCEMQDAGYPGQQMQGMPYQAGQVYNTQQQYAAAAGQGGGNPWAQYPEFQRAYQAGSQQQASDPAHQAAWAAYYQQVYAAQAQTQGGQGGAQQPPQGQAGQAGQDLQAQWAEYYRSLGYPYPYGQQGGAGQPSAAPSDANPEQKLVYH